MPGAGETDKGKRRYRDSFEADENVLVTYRIDGCTAL